MVDIVREIMNYRLTVFGPVLPLSRQQVEANCSCYTERKGTKSDVGAYSGGQISRWGSWGGRDTVIV
jgi:hypothetical protein